MRKIPLLDLGNVVVKVDFTPFLEWLTEKSEAKDFEKAQALLRSSLFYDFEFGNVHRAAFAKRLAAHFQAQFSLADLEDRFCTIFPGLVEGMEPLLEELASEGPVYCLSNTNEIHLQYVRERFPVLQKFTRIFASHEMRRRKPYPGIYRDVTDELAVQPNDVVFFDDVQANVQGALRAGLEAHLFTDAGQLKKILQRNANQDDNDRSGVGA